MSETNVETAMSLTAALAVLRRRKIWIAGFVPAGLLLSMFVAYILPAAYRSSATIILESAAIQKDLIQESVTSYADQQIEIISGRVMTPETLTGLVQQYDPYPNDVRLTATQKAQRVLENMELQRVDPVTGLPLDKSSAFELSYQNPDPSRAAAVAARLAELFLSYHQRVRMETARAATKFLQAQANSISKDLAALDQQYAQLRVKYGEAMPDADTRNQAARDRAERDLDGVQRELRVAQERESLLAIQLGGLSPNLMANKGDLTDLATVKAQLADAEQRYTPDHPDVKRLRRALASLMTQGSRGGVLGAAGADNPEYLRVASELSSARKEVAALQSSAQNIRSEMEAYSGYLRRSPEVEREFAALQRQRESLQTQFQQAQEKLQSAQLGQVFESENQGEHFSMIRAPVVSGELSSPNRLGIILLGTLLGCGLAAVSAMIAEITDETVRGARDLLPYRSITVLGRVPVMLSGEDRRRRLVSWSSMAAVYAVGLLLVVGAVYWDHVRLHRIAATNSTQ
jgi:polysaccharide biosynthesis transport protein